MGEHYKIHARGGDTVNKERVLILEKQSNTRVLRATTPRQATQESKSGNNVDSGRRRSFPGGQVLTPLHFHSLPTRGQRPALGFAPFNEGPPFILPHPPPPPCIVYREEPRECRHEKNIVMKAPVNRSMT